MFIFSDDPAENGYLVDAGFPGRAMEIVEAAEAHFGDGSRPEAIF